MTTTRATVPLIGVGATILLVLMNVVPSLESWQRRNFTTGVVVVIAYLAAGYMGAGTGRKYAGAKAGVTVGLMMVLIGWPLISIIQRITGQHVDISVIVALIDVPFVIAIAAGLGALGGRLRRHRSEDAAASVTRAHG